MNISRRAFLATTAAATLAPGVVTADAAAVVSSGVAVDPTVLPSLPTTGAPWSTLLSAANGSLGYVKLSDQNSTTAGKTFGAALAYARTGNLSYRDKVTATLSAVTTAPLAGARVLSLGRQLAGFVAAADLVGYRDPSFMARMSELRTLNVGGHTRWYTINRTAEDAANNWGGWALASRTAISAYVGDTADLAQCERLFSGYFDRAAYSGFRRTADYDPNWSHDPTAFVPVNPAGFPGKSGACVEDISRSTGTYPTVDSTGLTYSWEFLGGALLTARVLSLNGFPGVFSRGQDGLLRAGQFLASRGGWPPQYSVNQYIPWEIENRYGVNVGAQKAAGFGRQFGFTDWLTS